MKNGLTYDLKVGYTCNNNCVHCVIENNKRELQNQSVRVDQTYKEIIDSIDSEVGKESTSFVITGGEPTIRPEFVRIIKYISKNYPNKKINIQTNGRLLGQYAEELKGITDNIFYVIALHSMNKEIHNKITGNLKGDPYTETINSIKKLKSIYINLNEIMRIEIVLSKYNVSDLSNTINELYELGIKYIGVSYPHMDGMYEYEKEKAKEISISYADLKPQLYEVYKILEKNEDLEVAFEEVPRCMYRDKENNLLPMLKNLKDMSHSENSEVVVNFPGKMLDENFSSTFKKMHRQSSKCSECILCCKCLGTWYEAVEMFDDLGFVPIKEGELNCTT